MKWNSRSLPMRAALALLASLACTQAQEEGKNEGKSNPYESIIGRNPFGLRPPPPPAPPDTGPPAPPPPLATVEVTGVTSIFSKKKALVEIVPGPGKPPMKLTLDEGERVDAIEIVAIDVDKAEVTINNAGTVTNIALKVAKAPAGGAVPAAPGLPQPPGINPALPTPINPNANTFSSSGRAAPIVAGGAAPSAFPAANFGAQPINTYGQPGTIGQPGGIYTGAGNTSPGLINRPIRTQAPALPQGQPGVAPAIDPAVQYINMAVQKQTMEAKGIPLPPLPPVPGLDH